ncbi:MAG: polyprenol monophosphomannose synthase [Actinomycetota bacterium]
MRVLVAIPTYDEADNIVELLDRLAVHVPEADVLVVDDGSPDGTAARVRSAMERRTRSAAPPNGCGAIRVVERSAKSGLGSAYRLAFGEAIAGSYDVVVEMDADLSHDAAALPTMLAVADHGIDVVIGSRYVPGGGVDGWPRRRVWLSRWGNRYAAFALGLAINDATAGFRVYRTDLLRRLDVESVSAEGYAFQVEMTHRAVGAGASIVEIPITFRDRVSGASKMDRRIVGEALVLVTKWAVADALSLRRRRRAYRSR